MVLRAAGLLPLVQPPPWHSRTRTRSWFSTLPRSMFRSIARARRARPGADLGEASWHIEVIARRVRLATLQAAFPSVCAGAPRRTSCCEAVWAGAVPSSRISGAACGLRGPRQWTWPRTLWRFRARSAGGAWSAGPSELAGPQRACSADLELNPGDAGTAFPAFADRGVDIETTHSKLLFVCYFVLTNLLLRWRLAVGVQWLEPLIIANAINIFDDLRREITSY